MSFFDIINKLLTYFVANALVLYLAHMYAGNFVVFGRTEIGIQQAIMTTAFGLTLASMMVDLLLKDFKVTIQPDSYLSLELLVNIGALYLLARTPLQNSVGIGISAFWVAIMVGITLSLAQYCAKLISDKK